ncbi:hypothetical protein B484DRAFT_458653 [Ochromonadaceae sp. CCMP2298]|nr:hypothetical protein B484DRAFT_458653 [Ochromonadaceae sp. CCMP2298]|mmetsp:Transcript_8666/g.19045  ORF Transcript_8666/g.19045 Transcript_8666/m.19045 type:complete len:294 (+) Transcript_8666:325-1206(+)
MATNELTAEQKKREARAKKTRDEMFEKLTRAGIDPAKDMARIHPSDFDIATLGTTPQAQQILERFNFEIEDLQDEQIFRKRKMRLFGCCFCSNIVGIVVLMWGMSWTVLFEKYDTSDTIVYISFAFYVPFIVWFCYLCAPCSEERAKRRRLWVARRRRAHFDRLRLAQYYGYVEEDKDELQRELKTVRDLEVGTGRSSIQAADRGRRSADLSDVRPKPALKSHKGGSHKGGSESGRKRSVVILEPLRHTPSMNYTPERRVSNTAAPPMAPPPGSGLPMPGAAAERASSLSLKR